MAWASCEEKWGIGKKKTGNTGTMQKPPDQTKPSQTKLTIVTANEVDDAAGEVARVVELGVLVGTVVLEQVEGDDAELGKRVRQNHAEEQLLPVEHRKHTVQGPQARLLKHHLLVDRMTLPALHLKVGCLTTQHIHTDSHEKKQAVEEMPFEPKLAGAHHILGLLRVL